MHDNIFSNKEFKKQPVATPPLKVIARWYTKLPKWQGIKAAHYAEQAGTILDQTDSLYNALKEGFCFSDTEEGEEYWNEILDRL